MADDPQTKQDQPSEGAAAPPEKVAQEAAEAKAAVAQEEAQQAPPEAPEEASLPVDELAADTPDKPTASAEPAAAATPAEAPVPSRRAKKADEKAADPAPARRGRRGRRGGEDTPEPAAEPKRRAPLPEGQRPIVRAQAKYVRTSARKARLVCDHIRGKTVNEARAILAHAPRAVAQDWRKLLESAVANAENNHELLGDDLRILAVYADEGPTLKRFRPRAMGRATRIRRRTSHLTITLTPKE
jgi:ribosomal protein L22